MSKGSKIASDQGEDIADANVGKLSNFASLFKYATAVDFLLLFVGGIGSAIVGFFQVGQMILFADAIDVAAGQSTDPYEMAAATFRLFITVAVVCGAGAWVYGTCFRMTGLRQGAVWRKEYLLALLRQEIGWFDVNNPMELPTKVSEKTQAVEDGLGNKVGEFISFMAQGFGGIAISFYYSWQIALFSLIFTPVLVGGVFILTQVQAKVIQKKAKAYAKAGGTATEVIGNIRTVAALQSEPNNEKKYDESLQTAMEAETSTAAEKGFAAGLLFSSGNLQSGACVIFSAAFILAKQMRDTAVSHSNPFCQPLGQQNCNTHFQCKLGIQAIYNASSMPSTLDDMVKACCADECPIDPADAFIAFFCIQMGCQAFGSLGPCFEKIGAAREACYEILNTIKRNPLVQSKPTSQAATTQLENDGVQGKLCFENVEFSYPSRMETKVYTNLSITLEAGKTTALVGGSGSGKSTAVQLVERFYDPLNGRVTLDGVDLRELDLHWLRSQMGLVSQEPVLFTGTIAENIGYGKPGSSQEEIQKAAEMANAHTFITEFEKGYETEVGGGGGKLSGGQKQRIAIARAIIKDPKILILDEATSALDNESERVVQAALDSLLAKHKRTTLVIAHRLTTIRNADKIIVLDKGTLVEEGTHDQLMAMNGAYVLLNAKNTNK